MTAPWSRTGPPHLWGSRATVRDPQTYPLRSADSIHDGKVDVGLDEWTASQLSPFDLVVLFMFDEIAITADVGDDHSLVAALTALSTIGLLHVGVSWVKARSAAEPIAGG